MMQNKRKIIILILIIIIIINLISILLSKKHGFYDDLIFFKFFNLEKINSFNDLSKTEEIKGLSYIIPDEEKKSIFFKVKYKGMKFENINITDTINTKTLVNEKIAPGTTGEFEIIITSNEKINYKVMFQSKNKKPTNMNFYIKGDKEKYSTLEQLQEKLTGSISKDEVKKIHINWEWNYISNNDYQDTEDGLELKEYNFDIYTIGY